MTFWTRFQGFTHHDFCLFLKSLWHRRWRSHTPLMLALQHWEGTWRLPTTGYVTNSAHTSLHNQFLTDKECRTSSPSWHSPTHSVRGWRKYYLKERPEDSEQKLLHKVLCRYPGYSLREKMGQKMHMHQAFAEMSPSLYLILILHRSVLLWTRSVLLLAIYNQIYTLSVMGGQSTVDIFFQKSYLEVRIWPLAKVMSNAANCHQPHKFQAWTLVDNVLHSSCSVSGRQAMLT